MCPQVHTLGNHLHPERLKVITQELEAQAQLQSQTLLRLQQMHGQTTENHAHSPKVAHPAHTHVL